MNFNLFQEKLLDYLLDDPNFCVNVGALKNLGDLPDPGKNKRVLNQGKLKMLVNTLSRIKKNELSFSDQINYELCELTLEQNRLNYELEIDGIPQKMRMPMASKLIYDPIFLLFINDPRDPKYRLVNIISRLQKVDGFIISYCRNIKEPVERWVEMELDRLPGIGRFFQNIYDWGEATKFKNLELLKKSIESANNSLKKYKTFLENTSVSKNIHIGKVQMESVIKSRGISLSAVELFEMAKDFLKKNSFQIEKYKVILIKKYNLDVNTSSEELQKFLAKKYRVSGVVSDSEFNYILDRYKAERDKVLSFIKERDLFPIVENQEMLLMNTPEFMRPSIPAGAMMPPAPLREGVKKSLIYLTLTKDLVDEHTEISIPTMMIHEGIPGHHLQFSHAAENEFSIRKLFHANDLSEGWTTMLEDYMLDCGYAGELENEIRFAGKKDIARIGARVVIDLFFMSGDRKYLEVGVDCDLSSEDPFICAGNLLQAVTGFVPERVKGELNWYSQECGYPLSYLTGNQLVWKLKQKYISIHKEQLSELEIDRKFHSEFLSAGNMPVKLLEKIILKSQ